MSMKIEPLSSRETIAVTVRRGQILQKRALKDMSNAELEQVLRSTGRVAQRLVNEIYAELAIRKTNQQIALMRADAELTEEVVQALVAEGRAEKVARELVNTEAKMLAQAKRLEII